MPDANKKPENPEAFAFGFGTDNYSDIQRGMTLRDYFAAKAMQAYLSNHLALKMENREGWAVNDMADSSFVIADAMLKQRAI